MWMLRMKGLPFDTGLQVTNRDVDKPFTKYAQICLTLKEARDRIFGSSQMIGEGNAFFHI